MAPGGDHDHEHIAMRWLGGELEEAVGVDLGGRADPDQLRVDLADAEVEEILVSSVAEGGMDLGADLFQAGVEQCLGQLGAEAGIGADGGEQRLEAAHEPLVAAAVALGMPAASAAIPKLFRLIPERRLRGMPYFRDAGLPLAAVTGRESSPVG